MIGEAIAQETPMEQAKPIVSKETKVNVIKKEDLQPSFRDAFLKVLGRKQDVSPYVVVVGKTTESADAIKFAETLKIGLIKAGAKELSADVKVLRPAQTRDYYVTVGNLTDSTTAHSTQVSTTTTAVAGLTSDNWLLFGPD